MITFEDVSLSYDGKNIFKDFSLEIGRGENVVLSGPSGTGKSSFFSLILGFARPEKGSVFFEGREVDEKHGWHVRQRAAFVDQDVSLGQGKVVEWFDFVAGLKVNQGLDFSREKIKSLFDVFELEHSLLDNDIERLSGGERQRAAIVTAVMLNRDVFLLDEITASLDKQLKKKVADFFVQEKAWTVVVISHDDVWLDRPETRVFDVEAKKWIR